MVFTITIINYVDVRMLQHVAFTASRVITCILCAKWLRPVCLQPVGQFPRLEQNDSSEIQASQRRVPRPAPQDSAHGAAHSECPSHLETVSRGRSASWSLHIESSELQSSELQSFRALTAAYVRLHRLISDSNEAVQPLHAKHTSQQQVCEQSSTWREQIVPQCQRLLMNF